MNILDRYMALAAGRATLLVLVVLLALIGFIGLTGELQDVGKGTFQAVDAFVVVIAHLPRNAFDVFPIAALLGGMMGLGALAKHSELVALRAAGVGLRRLAYSMLLAGAVFAGAAGAVGELVMPGAERFADAYSDELKRDRDSLSGLSGSWLRDGERIFNILQLESLERLGGVYVYRFDEGGRLESVALARRAQVGADRQWTLEDVAVTRIGATILTEQLDTLVLETGIDPGVMSVSVIDTNSMSIPMLREYIRYLEANDLQAGRYEMALWQRVANVAAVPAMLLLALPFVFGPLRSGGNSARFVVGFLVGIVYILGKGALADGAQVYGAPIWLTAWLPVAAIFLAAMFGLSRVR
ncbi:LPS export ABC transporter permease LptG [Thioalkalivibrio sp. XN279]|uniref:LPS export ABC transporter permease LptG n=1 Tax=Thioalkalivibrio sp. XN279 TaxID=2714953 RepID=UPI00140A9DA4|nr:LPS export ABC transporter permease LptG [Thioalkalivibrio sp. XN279]NHA14792.1 LPS export ABC transporter permease LptG [Thioalkalivibrio sp. XN279]